MNAPDTRLLDALFQPGDGLIELRAIKSGGGAVVGRDFVKPGDTVAVQRFAKQHQDAEVYYGVAARRDNSGGGLNNCCTLGGIFADIDLKSNPDGKEHLNEFRYAPSAIVSSGGGFHAYWFTKEPIDLQVENGRVKNILRRLAHAIGADDGSAEPAHVLRVPGTLNHKKEYPEPRPVELISINNFRYDISDFDEFLPELEERQFNADHRDNYTGDTPPADDALLNRARAYASKIPGAVEGENGDKDTFRAAAAMRDFGLSEEQCFEVLNEEYNPRCLPSWSEQELRKKIRNAYSYATGAPGSKANHDHNAADAIEPNAEPQMLSVDELWSYMPTHSYIWAPGRDLWPGSSINARLPKINDADGKPMNPSQWLDVYKPVEQMTWAPGEPMIIRDQLISEGGWIPRKGSTVFNLYRPPQKVQGDPAQAVEWVAHLAKVYPSDMENIIPWLAHRVQRPQEKINHALVLGGLQGIGKDTILEPVKYAVGSWNFCEISPAHLLGRFNGFTKSVILRINEARDLGDVDRFAFYDHLKAYTAAPPDVLRCDEKNLREHAVLNVCGVIITTNHKTDGIYLPADDRRHYVAWSDLCKEDFKPDYWTRLYRWYADGGNGHVAAYLRSIDLSTFDAKAPPAKTEAFWSIVDASRAPEDSELADALDALGNPMVVTLADIITKSRNDFAEWLRDRRNSRQIPHRMESVGYVPIRNDAATDGQWKIGDRRQTVYGKRELSVRDRIQATYELVKASRGSR